MNGASLMLHLELGRPNAGLLQVAGALAERLHAGVIGVAACQPMVMAYGEGYVSAELMAQDSREIRAEMAAPAFTAEAGRLDQQLRQHQPLAQVVQEP